MGAGASALSIGLELGNGSVCGKHTGQLRVLADSRRLAVKLSGFMFTVGRETSSPSRGTEATVWYHIHLRLNDNVDENHVFQRQALREEIALFYCFSWK